MPDQMSVIVVLIVVVLGVTAYAIGYRHGRVDGYLAGLHNKLHIKYDVTFGSTTRGTISDRPYPTPGSPFGPPPDVPAIPEYDQKGIRPGWPPPRHDGPA